uniref:Cupin-like domain-containing protein n=1 Tax=Candidatus Kentrum sp. TUN TaxID=2126343 RepID=A0A451AFL8_9GAMM|nr:MAG: Cupin-like domain-containing protein [Candidatus Kentron sp. TUN]
MSVLLAALASYVYSSHFYHVLSKDFHKIHLLDNNQKDWTLDLPPKEQSELTWIFMGLKGSGIGTHMDRLGQHVCSAQIFGRKHWILHPPEDTKWLYHGDVNLMEPDYLTHPRYINASPAYDFVLERGEVLDSTGPMVAQHASP